MSKKIRVIDVFAGPGGLGEGFAACKKDSPFEIVMSVEAEENAHKTLTHRAFYRRLSQPGKSEFLSYIRALGKEEREGQLDALKEKFFKKWCEACVETLGEPTSLGNSKIWKKLEKGQALTAGDKKDTDAQVRISRRIEDIRSKCAEEKTPLIVIGGPPCQSYSNAGRSRVRAIEGYKPDEDQRFFLYREYSRVLAEAKPDAFIMENVEGILSAKLANGTKIIKQVLKTLKQPSLVLSRGKKTQERYYLYSLSTQPDDWDGNEPIYNDPKAFVMSADEYGVPQTRKRVIILGIRAPSERLDCVVPKNQSSAPTVQDVIDTLPAIRSTISNKKKDPKDKRKKRVTKDSQKSWDAEWLEIKKNILAQLNDAEVKDSLKKINAEAMLNPGNSKFYSSNESGFSEQFERKAESKQEYDELRKWILGPNSKVRFSNHKAKAHQYDDRLIYMFVAAFTKVYGKSPKATQTSDSGELEFPKFLAPNHKNWESGNYSDRFRCLSPDFPGKTITSHLKKDGHAYIHYDPRQNRCITPREAARIQTFPDDYFFEGETGAQYQQVGNAVPPYLAKKIALIVNGLFLR